MDSTPTSPIGDRPRRDTGFPEPFCGRRNTTLPHPEADLSPNASISADDVDTDRILSRTRRSFLQKHKRTISHGMITPDMVAVYSDTMLLGGESAASPDESALSPGALPSRPATATAATSSVRLSADGTDSLESAVGDEAPTNIEVPTLLSLPTPRSRRKGVLWKLRIHK